MTTCFKKFYMEFCGCGEVASGQREPWERLGEARGHETLLNFECIFFEKSWNKLKNGLKSGSSDTGGPNSIIPAAI